jgi:hypothetical protein
MVFHLVFHGNIYPLVGIERTEKSRNKTRHNTVNNTEGIKVFQSGMNADKRDRAVKALYTVLVGPSFALKPYW